MPENVKILVVDDDPNARRLLARYFERGIRFPGEEEPRTCQVFEAQDGKEAFGVVGLQPLDVAFIDYLLPDTTGLDIIAKLKANPAHTDLPMIMMSGNGSEAVAAKAVRAGAIDYIVKGALSMESLGELVPRTIRENTERRRIRRAQQEGRILDAVMDRAVIGVDREGRVIYCNRVAEDTFGRKAEEVRGRGILDFAVSGAFQPRATLALAEFANLDPVTMAKQSKLGDLPLGETFPAQCQHKDGREFDASIFLKTTALDGQPILVWRVSPVAAN